MSETRIRFLDKVLTDNMYENVVDQYQLRSRRRITVVLLVVVVVLAVILWLWLR